MMHLCIWNTDGTQRKDSTELVAEGDPDVFLSIPVEEALAAVTKFKMLGKVWR